MRQLRTFMHGLSSFNSYSYFIQVHVMKFLNEEGALKLFINSGVVPMEWWPIPSITDFKYPVDVYHRRGIFFIGGKKKKQSELKLQIRNLNERL